MYERSAIVLERYYNNILGYFSENNLKVNFENYCSLVEKIDKFQLAFEKEQTAINEFEDVTDRLKTIQKTQEKLYQKNAKLEFNRNILFNNIGDPVEEIENCLIKIENGIGKNEESLRNLRTDFINTLNEYNEKNSVLSKSQREKKGAEKLYKEILEASLDNIDNINEFALEVARNFNASEFKEKVYNLMLENGKDEKIPFDENVITLATELGTDIYQKEVQCYIEAYDGILKLFSEIENDDISITKFKRKLRNIKTMLHFLNSVKEYLVQFLDYERMMSLSGKKTHAKLMELACENFKLDVVQINNLYELIIKESTNKATQKIYKELYNKSYLLEIKREEESLKKEKNKVDATVATVLGSNYWRIEGIKNIYTVFYKEISETFGRDLDEFEVPKDVETEVLEEKKTEIIETVVQKEPKISIVEEISENELPQLLAEEEIETPQVVEVIKKERKRGRTKKAERLEEVPETKIETIKKEKKKSKEIDIAALTEKLEENLSKVVEKSKIELKDIVEEKTIVKPETVVETQIVDTTLEKEKAIEEITEIDYSEKLQKIAEENIAEINFEGVTSKEAEIKQEVTKPGRGRRSKSATVAKEESVVKAEKTKGKRVKPKESTKIKENKKEIVEEKTIDDLEKRIQELEDIEPISENVVNEEIENEEESLFGNIKSNKEKEIKKINLEMIQSLEKKDKSSKKGLFSSLIKINNKKGKRALS